MRKSSIDWYMLLVFIIVILKISKEILSIENRKLNGCDVLILIPFERL